jgi:serine/threonine-protein kinase HipA
MTDHKLMIWTQISGSPIKMGELYITDSESRFTYESNYYKSGHIGLGLVYSPELFKDITINRKQTNFFNFHPPIQSLLPPKSDRNFTRNLILSYLSKKGIFPKQGLETDLEILKISGHGGIGHLDIFSSDQEAEKWYQLEPNDELFKSQDNFGFSLKEFLTWMDNDASDFISIIGPTPSLGGAIPKISLSIPKEGWNGMVALPTKMNSNPNLTDIILKFEDEKSYPGIIELEQLGLEIHKQAGFEIPRHWNVEINGIKGLAVERFDRSSNHKPLFMESVYSVLASGNNKITNHYSTSYETIGKAINNTKIDIVKNKKLAKEELFKRLTLAILTGNGDLHLENLSFLEKNNTLSFSPVYDPTPMRAYSRHNMLVPNEMTFGNYGEVKLNEALINFSRVLSLKLNKVYSILENEIKVLKNYDEKIGNLKYLPDINKENLINIHLKLKENIVNLLNESNLKY